MKPGDLVRKNPNPNPDSYLQIFDNVTGDWFGIIIKNELPTELPSRYNRVHILLSSHNGIIGKSWLTPQEIKNHIEVLSETW